MSSINPGQTDNSNNYSAGTHAGLAGAPGVPGTHAGLAGAPGVPGSTTGTTGMGTAEHHGSGLGSQERTFNDQYGTENQHRHHDPTHGSGQNAFNSDRPMNVQPTSGGVAVGGHENLPEGHASATDKVVGKTQKVVGKMTNDPVKHEKGELREAGGKAAAEGGARAPHD